MFSDEFISKIDTSAYKVFISGTQAEQKLVLPLIQNHKDAIDITGQMSLKEFISFINEAIAAVKSQFYPTDTV